MAFTMRKYGALVRKHGREPADAAVAAFEVMRTRAARNVFDPWAVVTRAMQLTLMYEAKANGLLCSPGRARRPKTEHHRDAERFSERATPVYEYHPAFWVEAEQDEHSGFGDERDEPTNAFVDRVVEVFTALGWPADTARTGIEYICNRLMCAGSRPAAFEALRRDRHAQALLDLDQRGWLAMLRAVLDNFGANEDLGGDSGGEDSSPPSPCGGKTREQASTMVCGRLGFQRYEQISSLKQITNDPGQPANVRELVRHELAAIDSGGSVHPAYTKVMAALELAEASDGSGNSSPDDLETLAAEALARARQERARGGGRIRSSRKADAPTRRSLRSFILTWTDLDGWRPLRRRRSRREDPDKDWEIFERVLRETDAFAEAARAARQRDERSASA